MDRDDIRALIEGADLLFTNAYEEALTEQKTGWSSTDVLARVRTRVTTLGPDGARIERQGEPTVRVHVPEEERRVDPTGVGDAFRAGFLSAVSWGLPLERAAEVGCLLATYVIETVGTQEYQLDRAQFLLRLAKAYGDQAAADVEPHLPGVSD
jgi:adenosine kinase